MPAFLQVDISLNTTDLNLPTLLRLLARWTDELESLTPSPNLWTRHDWTQHDGFQSEWRPSTFAELRAVITSPQSLIAAMPGDNYVHLAFWPAQKADWYLRFLCDTGNSPDDPWYSVDLLSSNRHASCLIDSAASEGIALTTKPIADFLRSTDSPPSLEGFLQHPQ
jgi:hypothetical protein